MRKERRIAALAKSHIQLAVVLFLFGSETISQRCYFLPHVFNFLAGIVAAISFGEALLEVANFFCQFLICILQSFIFLAIMHEQGIGTKYSVELRTYMKII